MNNSSRDAGSAPPSVLNDKIDELEVLLDNRSKIDPQGPVDDNIPVLDDIVEFDDTGFDDELFSPVLEFDTEFIEEKVHHAMDNIDEKITEELEGLVNILKNSIKDSVLTEIRQQLESEHNHLAHKRGDEAADKQQD